MFCTNRFNEKTKKYLCCYNQILNDMIEGINEAELSNSISHNFIVQMIPHHEAAIRMSKNILRFTECVPLQKIAKNIIESQTKSIANMRDILCRCDCVKNSCEDICCYNKCFQQITRTMFDDMKNVPSSNNLNNTFMKAMIPHHKGAVRMSENALKYPICPELVPIIKSIITSQEKGIRELEELLRCK